MRWCICSGSGLPTISTGESDIKFRSKNEWEKNCFEYYYYFFHLDLFVLFCFNTIGNKYTASSKTSLNRGT